MAPQFKAMIDLLGAAEALGMKHDDVDVILEAVAHLIARLPAGG